jgi:hypothetical protein
MSTIDETPREITIGNGQVPDEVVGQADTKPVFSKEAWTSGPSDIVDDVIDLDGGRSVRVRSLTAGQQARISEMCSHVKGQVVTVDQTRIKALKFSYGVVEPSFDEYEAYGMVDKFGHDVELVVGVIDLISGATEEEIEKAKRRFRPRR